MQKKDINYCVARDSKLKARKKKFFLAFNFLKWRFNLLCLYFGWKHFVLYSIVWFWC